MVITFRVDIAVQT